MEPVIMSGNVINTLKAMQQRKAAIDSNPQLSDIGKQQATQQLAAERNAYQSKALQTFAGDWQEMRRVYGDLKAEREAIAEKAAKSWDYGRLNYARETAVGAIRKAQTPQDVQSAYDSVKLGGDRHSMRAFAETAASMIGGVKQFAVNDRSAAINLQKAMQDEAAKITATPDMVKQSEAEAKLSASIADLYKATRQAANAFDPKSAGMFDGSNNPFLKLLDGVSVKETVDHMLAIHATVDLNWD